MNWYGDIVSTSLHMWDAKEEKSMKQNNRSYCKFSLIIKTFDHSIFWSFWWKCVLTRGDIGDWLLWLTLRTRSKGKLCSNTSVQIFCWRINFSSSKNFSDGSTITVVPQSIDLRTLCSQSAVCCRLPQYPFNNELQYIVIISCDSLMHNYLSLTKLCLNDNVFVEHF